jgi:DNA-binding NarL/FixJ family response regulator
MREKRSSRKPVRRPRPAPKITVRELQVCRLLCGPDEPAVKALPGVLDLSLKTVQAHQYKLYRKVGVRTRTGLLLKAIELGLIPCPCQGKAGRHGHPAP